MFFERTIIIFFKKWANPGLFFVYLLSFQTNNTIFTTNQCEKMVCSSSMQRQYSNPWPSEHESPPVTTRPGLPPDIIVVTVMGKFRFLKHWPLEQNYPDLTPVTELFSRRIWRIIWSRWSDILCYTIPQGRRKWFVCALCNQKLISCHTSLLQALFSFVHALCSLLHALSSLLIGHIEFLTSLYFNSVHTRTDYTA